MAFLTNEPPFTNQEDVRISFDGWIVASGVGVDALGGGDVVEGLSASGEGDAAGILISGGALDGGGGSDTIKGRGATAGGAVNGILITLGGALDAGFGDDKSKARPPPISEQLLGLRSSLAP